MNKILGIIRLLRIEQWIKNIFIFLPLFFDKKIFDIAYLIPVCFVALYFSLTSSIVYIINDIRDIDADRKHPQKSKRPLAANVLTISNAYLVIFFLIIIKILLLLYNFVGLEVLYIIEFYFFINLLYTFILKKYAIIDVTIIALGFTLRVFSGGFAVDIVLSKWILIMSFLITLLLAFAKRRNDCSLLLETGKKMRQNSDQYSLDFINNAMSIIASVTIVAYLQYCLDPKTIEHYGTDMIYITFIFVLLGILRYLQIAIVKNDTGSPTKLMYKDRFLQICIFLYIIVYCILIYA